MAGSAISGADLSDDSRYVLVLGDQEGAFWNGFKAIAIELDDSDVVVAKERRLYLVRARISSQSLKRAIRETATDICPDRFKGKRSRLIIEPVIDRLKKAGVDEKDATEAAKSVGDALATFDKKAEKEGYKTYEEEIDLKNAFTLRVSLEKIAEKPVQTASTDDTSVEVTFWKSIQGSKDPAEYRAYLESFPKGKFAPLAKLKIKKLGGGSVAKASVPSLDYGRYYALVIGNDNYKHLKPLSNAVNDANDVASLLRSKYQFNVNVLTNATRDEIVSALSKLPKTVSAKDNILIYYAGHGWLDKDMDEGFWLPIDAVEDDQVHWVANDTIMRSVRAMKAKHVMVVADSCFSGTLTRGIKVINKSPDYIKEIVKKKARTVLTSGGLEPVSDVGGGNNSVFAASFLRILNENPGVMNGSELFIKIRKQVMQNTKDQTPEYGDIRKAGHDGGDFLFVRQ
mgnify:CR=1 FL=1